MENVAVDILNKVHFSVFQILQNLIQFIEDFISWAVQLRRCNNFNTTNHL